MLKNSSRSLFERVCDCYEPGYLRNIWSLSLNVDDLRSRQVLKQFSHTSGSATWPVRMCRYEIDMKSCESEVNSVGENSFLVMRSDVGCTGESLGP